MGGRFDRITAFVVMDYLRPARWDLANAFILGNSWRLHQWLHSTSIRPRLYRASTHAAAKCSATPLVDFFAEQRIGWQLLNCRVKRHFTLAGTVDAIVEHVQQRLASHQPQPLCMADRVGERMALTALYLIQLLPLSTESNAIWRCYCCIPISHRRFMMAISLFRRYRWIFRTGSRIYQPYTRLIGQAVWRSAPATAQKRWIGCLRYRYSPCRIRAIRHFSLHETQQGKAARSQEHDNNDRQNMSAENCKRWYGAAPRYVTLSASRVSPSAFCFSRSTDLPRLT